MASIYKKSGKWWCRLKGVKQPGMWGSKPTPFKGTNENENAALRYALAAQKAIDARSLLGVPSAMTVAEYAEQWLHESHRQALASHPEMVGHLRNHVLKRIGAMLMIEVRPRHVRDVVRFLKTETDLAPKTILNVFGTMRTMFHDAVVDEIIPSSPCVVSRDELPAKVDKDPEWRELATYERPEVVQLLTSVKIPVERRVQYCLKALVGLRHGEVAGVRWRMWLPSTTPLGKLTIARTYVDKRTKTKITKPVPVHPELAKVLAAWKTLWPQIYGDEPTPDDFVVPTRNRTPVDPSDAGIAFKLDLEAVGLRVEAGEHRARGGHDLRAWFISSAIEDGAPPDALYAITHTKKKDVGSGYNRHTWKRLCEAVACLKIDLGDDPLALDPGFATRELSLRRRWYKNATPTGFEPVRTSAAIASDRISPQVSSAECDQVRSDDDLWEQTVVTGCVGSMKR